MIVEATNLSDCFVVTPTIFKDSRGYFFESFNQKQFKALTDIDFDIVQTNQSVSSKGVLRGLHFQKAPYAQAKLVRVIKGSVIDVCVDLRKDSKTFGEHFSIKLTSENNKQLFVPRGFAHGFITLEDDTIFCYQCDNFYHKASEGGIIYNDSQLNIDWVINEDEFNVSEKDLELPNLETILNQL